MRLRGQVKLVAVVVFAAHHGFYVACLRVDSNERRFKTLIANCFKTTGYGSLGVVLNSWVDGGVHLKAALHNGVLVEISK